MRVAYFSHMGDINGPAHTLRPRLRSLTLDDSLHVAVPSAGAVEELYGDIADTAVLPIRPVRVPTDVAQSIQMLTGRRDEFLTLRNYLRTTNPQLVVVASTTLLGPILAARRASCPVISYCGEIFDVGSRSRGAVVGLYLAAVVRLSDAVVCCSHVVANQFRRVRASNTHVVFPGVDAAAWNKTDRASARQRLGLPREAPVIATVGTLSRGRGQDLVVQALPRLVAAFPGLVYLVVGRPHPYDLQDELGRLLALADRLNVKSSVRFLDYTPSPRDVFAASDVVVNPARFPEPFGRVAIEALASERPVVATDVGAAREVLHHEKTALLVEPESVEGLEMAIGRVLNEPGLCDQLVRGGRQDIACRFSEAASTEQFIAICRSAVDRVGT